MRVPAEPGGLLAGLATHVRVPLFRNAYALFANGVVTSALGVVYWALAARLYPAAEVGANSALLALVMLLGSLASLNLRSGFSRFVPQMGERTTRFIAAGFLASIGVAIIAGIVAMILAGSIDNLRASLAPTPLIALVFVATTVFWTIFTVQDAALTALAMSVWIPLENGIFAVAKIVLLVALAIAPGADSMLGGYAILASWVLPTTLGAIIVPALIFAVVLPRRTPPVPRPGAAPPPHRLQVLGFIGGDNLGSLFAVLSSSILPTIVLGIAGAASSAHFYMVSLIGSGLQLVPFVLAASVLVEASADRISFDRAAPGLLRHMLLLVVPVVLVVVIAAPILLGIFGASYADEATLALRLYALSTIPYAINILALTRLKLLTRIPAIVIVQALSAALLLIPSVVALPSLGITAIGAAMLGSHTLMAIVLWWTQLRPRRKPSPESLAEVEAPPEAPEASEPAD